MIGITTRTRLFAGSFGEQPTHTSPRLYAQAVVRAGGVPVLLPPEDAGHAAMILDRLDGLVLTGGGDIAAEVHGRKPHPSLYDLDSDRDAFEIELVREAKARRFPVLAICRGMQILNVALGGDLVVDIPTEVGTTVRHRSGVAGEVATHDIRLDADARVADLFGLTTVTVNSYHHQALRRVAPDLIPVAWTSDDVVEAVEPTDPTWPCWGFQWHPEYPVPDNVSSHRPFTALLDAVVERARESV